MDDQKQSPEWIPVDYREHNILIQQLKGTKSDRAVVLIGSSFLENSFKQLLCKSLIVSKNANRLFEPNGSLNTFMQKIEMSFCLGLISSDIYHDANIIKQVRNKFAHSYKDMAFEKSPIKDYCNSLQLVNLFPIKCAPREVYINVNIFLSAILTMKTFSLTNPPILPDIRQPNASI